MFQLLTQLKATSDSTFSFMVSKYLSAQCIFPFSISVRSTHSLSHLDQDEDVLLFTKLKKGKFTIDTPFGNYTPDWGIVYRLDEDEAGIYFIVETMWR